MNLYLAKKHGGPLAPRDLREDALMTMWSLWAATTVEPHAINIVYYGPKGSKGHDRGHYAAAVMALRNPLAVLESALTAGNGHLVGDRFTVADLNVAEVVRYAQGAPELLEGLPRVTAWIAACQARPAYAAMMGERNAEPL
jgi:glutathione S-transferase